MFERYTDRARRSVILANEEARMLNHRHIGTEHLLLGLIHEGEGVAGQAFQALGINLETARERVEHIVGCGQQSPAGHLPFTPRLKKVQELALREALSLGHSYVGTEHLLLGLIREGEGRAVQALAALDVSPESVRSEVMNLLRGYQKAEAGEPHSVAVVYAKPPTLGDVLRAVEGLGTRLAVIERHLGIKPAKPSNDEKEA